MGSAAAPVSGAKIQDITVGGQGGSRPAGELVTIKGGARVLGDVVFINGSTAEGAVTKTNRVGSDGWMAFAEVPVAGTNNVHLKSGEFRVCTEAIADDTQGFVAGAETIVCWCKVTIGSGATFDGGTPFIAVGGQVHLAEATGAGGSSEKIVGKLAYQQTLATGVNVAAVIFNGSAGFGSF